MEKNILSRIRECVFVSENEIDLAGIPLMISDLVFGPDYKTVIPTLWGK